MGKAALTHSANKTARQGDLSHRGAEGQTVHQPEPHCSDTHTRSDLIKNIYNKNIKVQSVSSFLKMYTKISLRDKVINVCHTLFQLSMF